MKKTWKVLDTIDGVRLKFIPESQNDTRQTIFSVLYHAYSFLVFKINFKKFP